MTETMIRERITTYYEMMAFAEEHGHDRQVERLQEMVKNLLDELTKMRNG